MKTTLAILLLAATANAGTFQFRIESIDGGSLDTTPENPFDSEFELFDVTQTFWADASPHTLDILRWDFVTDDGTVLGSVAPHTVNLPFILGEPSPRITQYRTLDDTPTPWGEDIRWSYSDWARRTDIVSYLPSSGDRVQYLEVSRPEGNYRTIIRSRFFSQIPEPAAHILLAIVGVLAWCMARRGRA